MTQKQLQVLNELMEDKEFKGKKQLKHLIWLNTSKPKAQKGDCFIVSDPGHRVFGHPVHNFKAQVIGISSWVNEEEWNYELEMNIKCGSKEHKVKVWKHESELIRCKKCRDNENELPDPKSECQESLDVRI